MDPGELRAFAASLVRCLRGWDPLGADAHAPPRSQQKQDFVDALTELSALSADALDMEVRRLVVDAADGDGAHLARLVAALGQRDVLLKCKVANAVGSLCTSRVAGQRLLELHGAALVASLARMATSKNTWAQADAFFVFGWIVVVGEDALVDTELVRFIATAIKLLARNLQKKTTARELDEPDANLRVYCLVFLLNFSQRDVAALEPELVPLLETLQLLIARLLETTAVLCGEHGDDPNGRETLGEHIEFVRLAVTLLNALVDHVEAAPTTIIALKMLPQLLKLEQALHSDALETKLRELSTGRTCDGDQEADEQEDEGDDEDAGEFAAQLDDLKDRLRSIKEVVLAHR